MALTQPEEYPQAGGIDPRDENHPFFPKPRIPVFMKPLAQKVVEKHLWPEIILIFLLTIIGIIVMVGEQVPSALFFVLGAFTVAVLHRFRNIEEETHRKYLPSPSEEPLESVEE